MKLLPPSEAPKRVRFAIYALWAALAFGITSRFLFFDSQLMDLTKLIWLSAIGLALHGYFIVGISSGRNSARWVYPSLLLFGALAAPPDPRDPLDVLPVLVQAFALIVLFTGGANPWFKKARVPA